MPDPTRSKLIKDVLRILAVTAFFAAAAYLLHLPYFREEVFNIIHWREYSRSRGAASLLGFIGVFALATGCGVPRLWVSAAAGALYGALLGSLIGQIATLLGAMLNFFLGRWVLRGPIRRRLPARLRVWYDRFGDNGFRWVLYIRLFPLSNATVVNVISGASRVRLLDFLLATFLGYLPFTIAFALFGSSAAKQKPYQLLLGTVLFAAVVGARWLYNRFRPTENGSA